MFASVRTYRFSPAHTEELSHRLQDQFVPLLEQTPGFISYNWVTSADGQGVSVTVFQDEAGVRESVRMAADFRKKHLAHIGMTTPEIILGPVGAHSVNPDFDIFQKPEGLEKRPPTH